MVIRDCRRRQRRAAQHRIIAERVQRRRERQRRDSGAEEEERRDREDDDQRHGGGVGKEESKDSAMTANPIISSEQKRSVSGGNTNSYDGRFVNSVGGAGSSLSHGGRSTLRQELDRHVDRKLNQLKASKDLRVLLFVGCDRSTHAAWLSIAIAFVVGGVSLFFGVRGDAGGVSESTVKLYATFLLFFGIVVGFISIVGIIALCPGAEVDDDDSDDEEGGKGVLGFHFERPSGSGGGAGALEQHPIISSLTSESRTAMTAANQDGSTTSSSFSMLRFFQSASSSSRLDAAKSSLARRVEDPALLGSFQQKIAGLRVNLKFVKLGLKLNSRCVRMDLLLLLPTVF